MSKKFISKQKNTSQKQKTPSTKKASLSEDTTFHQFSPLSKGRIISRFGQHADVENEHREITRCHIRRNSQILVTGDWVMWRPAADPKQFGVIESILPREKVLVRYTPHSSKKMLAANIEQIVLVVTTQPALSTELIDRYLIATEYIKVPAIIAFNKVDLLPPEILNTTLETLSVYPKIGYPMITSSTKTNCGLDSLKAKLIGKTNIFIGQSGVGKSSLINSLIPNINAVTQALSTHTQLGQHTTTTARLYHFPEGGDLIDSPGIRHFSLPELPKEHLDWYFPEFRPFLGHCKFNNCSHVHESGCAVKQALANGSIYKIRLDSYLKLREKNIK